METTETTPDVVPEVVETQPIAPKDDAESPLKLLRKQLENLKTENEGYKRRDEEARRAKMTEEQQMREEVENLRAERDRISNENMRRKVGAEYKLPETLLARLVGSDEDSLRADAAELANLLPKAKIGSVSNPVRESSAPAAFKRSQLSDPNFYRANEAAIMQAYKDGRIEND